MFRFKQRLSTILGGRQLTSSEQAGLDAYDIELEDTLSNSGGDSFWAFDGTSLYNDRTQTAGITDVTISPSQTPTLGDTFLDMFDDGGGNATAILAANGTGGQATVSSAGIATLTSGTTVRVWATSTGTTTDIRGADFLILAATTNAASGGFGVQIRAAGDGTDVLILANGAGGNIVLTVVSGGYIKMGALPTADPGVQGAVWRDSVTNILHISP